MKYGFVVLALGLTGCAATVWDHPTGGVANLRQDIESCKETEMRRAREFDPDAPVVLRSRIDACLEEKGYVRRSAYLGERAVEY